MKTACILSIAGEAEPKKLISQLQAAGYQVDLIELEATEFHDLRGCDPSDLPDEIRSKIEAADLVVFYLSDTIAGQNSFESFALCATGGGADVIGVWPPGSEASNFPSALANLGVEAVTEGSQELQGVLSGSESSWEMPDGSNAPESDEKYQSKC